MSTSATTVPVSAAHSPDDRKPGYYIRTNLFFLAILVVAAIFTAYRLYQQFYAWDYGLDATAPEFDKYWMTLVKIQIPVLFGAGFICWGLPVVHARPPPRRARSPRWSCAATSTSPCGWWPTPSRST